MGAGLLLFNETLRRPKRQQRPTHARARGSLRRRVLLQPRAAIGGEKAKAAVVLDAAPNRAPVAEILLRLEQRLGNDGLAVHRPSLERLAHNVPSNSVGCNAEDNGAVLAEAADERLRVALLARR